MILPTQIKSGQVWRNPRTIFMAIVCYIQSEPETHVPLYAVLSDIAGMHGRGGCAACGFIQAEDGSWPTLVTRVQMAAHFNKHNWDYVGLLCDMIDYKRIDEEKQMYVHDYKSHPYSRDPVPLEEPDTWEPAT